MEGNGRMRGRDAVDVVIGIGSGNRGMHRWKDGDGDGEALGDEELGELGHGRKVADAGDRVENHGIHGRERECMATPRNCVSYDLSFS